MKENKRKKKNNTKKKLGATIVSYENMRAKKSKCQLNRFIL